MPIEATVCEKLGFWSLPAESEVVLSKSHAIIREVEDWLAERCHGKWIKARPGTAFVFHFENAEVAKLLRDYTQDEVLFRLTFE